MTAPTTEELLRRIEVLEARERKRSMRRGARAAFGAVALAALLAVPVGVFALHSFTDVSDSNTFHREIGRVKGAGITTGCTATKFCPNDHVTRGQMAAFLARTGGRSSTDGIASFTSTKLTNTSLVVLAKVSIKAGDVTGGTAIIQLTGSFTAYATTAAGLPTIARAYIREAGTTSFLSTDGLAQIDTIVAGGGAGVESVGLVGSVAVPTGVTKSYEIVARREHGTATVYGRAVLSAVYIPFAGNGTNAVPSNAPAPDPGPLSGPLTP